MTARSILLFAALCLIWGIPYLLIRVVVAEIPPVVLVFARTAIGALLLLPAALARGGLRAVGGKWPALLAFAAVEIAGPWLLLSSAERHLSSSLAGLLLSSVPLLAVLVAPLFGNRERIGPVNWLGLGLGLAGVAAIVGLDFRASDLKALLQMALVAVGYAVGPAILRRHLSGLRPASVTGISLAVCALAYAPAAALRWPRAMPGADVLVSLAVLAVVCTSLAFLLFFALIAEIGPIRATVVTYINPAVAAVLGVTVLHERLGVGMGLGFALVLAGSALATRRGAPSGARSG